MGPLIGQGRDGGVGHLVVIAIVGKGLAFPGPEDDVQRLPEAVAALVVRHAVDVIGPGKPAASDAEIEPALADLVHGGNFFGDPKRVVQRQHVHRHADAQPAGSCRNAAGDGDGRRQHRPVGGEVHFGQPGAVQVRIPRRHRPVRSPRRTPRPGLRPGGFRTA